MQLESKRCRCRLPMDADWLTMQQLYTDVRTGQFNPENNDSSADALHSKLQQWQRHWSRHRFGPWIIEEKIDHTRSQIIGVGGVSMRDFAGESLPNLWYCFFPDAWGKGFASEFTETCLAWLKQENMVCTVFALVNPQNVASLRVLEKLGMQLDKEFQANGHTSMRLRLDLDNSICR